MLVAVVLLLRLYSEISMKRVRTSMQKSNASLFHNCPMGRRLAIMLADRKIQPIISGAGSNVPLPFLPLQNNSTASSNPT